MGSGFLRDIALRKQLEEKVKEAAKVRQESEEEISAAKAWIDGARGVDADVAEAEAALAEATSLASGKDYKGALEKASEAKERGKRAYGGRARHLIDSTRTLLNVAKAMGTEDKEGMSALERAEDALAKEAYPEAVDHAKRAWKKSEKVIHEQLSTSFSTAQALIITARNLGKDTATAEDLLSRARSAVESNDFETALSFTKECLESVRGELQAEVDRAIQDAEGSLQTVREFGGDAANIMRLMDRARTDLQRGEYEKALNSLRQARQESEKALGKGLESRTSEFARMLAEAEGIGADVSAARELFKSFDRAMKEGRLDDATGIARKGYQVLQKAQFDRVVQTMSASRAKFVTAKNVGADISPAMEHLSRARAAIQGGRFREALDATKKADEAVEQVVREYQDVEGEFRTLQRSLAEAEVRSVDTTSAKRYLDRARSLLEGRDFRGAVDLIRRSREELDRIQSDRAMEVIEKAEFLLTAGEKMGAKLEESSRTLEGAVSAAKGKSFAKAIELATRSRELTERAVQKSLSDSITGLQSSIQFLGEDAASARSLADRAESALSARDFETAYGYVEEATRLTEGKTKDKVLQFHELLRGAIQIGIELGSDVSTLEASLKEVNVDIDRGKYAEVIGRRERVVREIGVVTENVFNLVKAKVVEAKNLQIDITDMRELLKRAKMAIGVEDHLEALHLLRECNEQSNKTVGRHNEVYNAISSAAAIVAEAKKRDVNVSKVLEMLLEAKRAHERFDHERALDLAQRAKTETEKLMVLYTSAQKIIAARELLDLVSKAGVDAPHLMEILDVAKEAMKNKDYDMALSYSERGEQEVRELIQERVQTLLSASESVIRSLETMNLLSQEQKVIRAREELDRGALAEALGLALAVREEIESLKKGEEAASVALGRARDMVTELEAMNIEPGEGAQTVARAEAAYEESRYEEVLNLTSEAVRALELRRQTDIDAMMTRFEEGIQKAKREDVDTRTAEKLLARAREFLSERKYRQALALAMQAEGEAEKVGLQQEMAAKAIETAEKKLTAFGSPTPDLKKMLDEAKRAMEQGDYIRALDVAIKTGEEFTHVRERYEEAIEVGKRAEQLYEVGSAIDLDVTSVSQQLQKARDLIEQGAPEAARDAYQVTLDAAHELVRSAVDRRIVRAREFIDLAKRLGANPSPALKKIGEAKAQFDAEDYEGASSLIQEGMAAAKLGLAKIVEDAIAGAQSNIEHSRKLGADTLRAGEMLGKARSHFQAGEYEAALQATKGASESIQLRMDSEKRFADRSFQAESMIRRARKFGIDVLDAERMLAEAIRAKKVDPDRATEVAEEALRIAHEAIESYSPSLIATLEVQNPMAGQWTEATLTLSNTAKAVAKDVTVKILGDAEVAGLKDLPTLRAKGTEALPLKVKMMAAGSIPLAIQIKSARLLDGKEYMEEVIATIEVAEPVLPSVEPPKVQATAESRCPMCKGLIKVGFTIRRCPHCNRDMHESCAARTPTCPSCGQSLAADVKRKKLSFKVP